MADTAAFFASKKKKSGAKKKTFKSFNANKIDASEVVAAAIQHVDAPAVDDDLGVANISLAGTGGEKEPINGASTAGGSGDGWDDDAVAARLPQRPVVMGATTKNLADMSTSSTTTSTTTTTSSNANANAAEESSKGMATELSTARQRGNDDDIAERLKVEETRAALAAAREGMEREGQRLQQEKEAKAAAAQQSSMPQPSGIGMGGGGGGKWLPPHLRGRTLAAPMSGRSGSGLGSSFQQRVNTEDENMFPDLAAADAILTQQQEHEKKAMATAKKSTGGPPAWEAGPAIGRVAGPGPGLGPSSEAAEADRAFMGGGGAVGERFGDRWRHGPSAPGLNAAGKPISMQNTSLQAATSGGSSPGAPVWRRGMPLPGKSQQPEEEAPKDEAPDSKKEQDPPAKEKESEEPPKAKEADGVPSEPAKVEDVPAKEEKDTPVEEKAPPAESPAAASAKEPAEEAAPEPAAAAAPAPAGEAKKKKKKKKDLSTFKVSS